VLETCENKALKTHSGFWCFTSFFLKPTSNRVAKLLRVVHHS
jgi:hypothetical protein